MIVKLTRINRELTESGEAKYDEYANIMSGVMDDLEKPTDEEGRNAEWYETMGMPVPDELKAQNQTFTSSTMTFDDDDYFEKKSVFLCNVEKVLYFDEYKDDRTMIIYGNKLNATGMPELMLIIVEETIHQVYDLIQTEKNNNDR